MRLRSADRRPFSLLGVVAASLLLLALTGCDNDPPGGMGDPDAGTARADFPGGSAETLYDSIQRLYGLPGDMRVFTCHDYQPGGRELRYRSLLREQRASNVQLDAENPGDGVPIGTAAEYRL